MVHNKNTPDNALPVIYENVSDTFLCSYSIASAEMRYNEVCSRDIFLRVDPEFGPIIRGEISGCEKGGFADLSQIFLEFALSCEGCKDLKVAEKSIICFGQHLGSIFVPTLQLDNSRLPSIDNLAIEVHSQLNECHIYSDEQYRIPEFYISYLPTLRIRPTIRTLPWTKRGTNRIYYFHRPSSPASRA